jgi:hypothetical protein
LFSIMKSRFFFSRYPQAFAPFHFEQCCLESK